MKRSTSKYDLQESPKINLSSWLNLILFDVFDTIKTKHERTTKSNNNNNLIRTERTVTEFHTDNMELIKRDKSKHVSIFVHKI